MESSYSLSTVPQGVPVGLDSDMARRLNSYLFAARRNPKYVIVEKITSSNYRIPEYDGCADISVLDPSGRRWRKTQYWVPKGSTLLPIQKEQADRLLKMKEKYESLHLEDSITANMTQSGADPEIFVVDKMTKQVIPAFAFLPDKKKPHIIPGDYPANLFWDGFQAEFTIGVFDCMQVMSGALRAGLLGTVAQARTKFPNAILSPDSVVEINHNVLGSVPEHHAALGCSRSENAYGTPAIRVDNPRMLPFRFAGGHIHFGSRDIPTASEETVAGWVKILDTLAGVASVLWFQGMENPIRRQFYGRAGEYRRPKHGLEYRTLGNAWLRHPALFHLMYGFTRTSLQFARTGLGKYLDVNQENVRDVVDGYDVKGAKEIVRKNKVIFKSILNYSYRQGAGTQAAYKALDSGVGELMARPDDVEANWNADTQQYLEWRYAANAISKGIKF